MPGLNNLLLSFTTIFMLSQLLADAHGGIIAYYRFETGPNGSTVNSIVDSGPNGLNGTVGSRSPAITYTSDTYGASSNFALEASGDGNYGQVANNALLRPAGDFTLELSVRPDVVYSGSNSDADMVLVMKNAEVGTGIVSYGIGYNQATASFYTELGTTGNVFHFLNGPTVTKGAWHHIALVFDENGTSDTYSMYTDGVLSGSTTADLPILYSTTLANPFVIGAGNFASDPNGAFRRNFGGDIDEIRLSDQALLPSQFIVAVPEPSTMVLLGIGASAVLIRRRSLLRR